MLEKYLWNSFLLYLVVQILQLLHEISSFPDVLYQRSVLKNFSKFTDKHKKQSSGVLSKEKMFWKFLQNSQKNIFTGGSFLIKLQAGYLKLSELEMFVKQGILKSFANFKEKKRCWSLFLIKLQLWEPAALLRKTLTHMLPCKNFLTF